MHFIPVNKSRFCDLFIFKTFHLRKLKEKTKNCERATICHNRRYMKGVLYLSEMVQLNPLFGYPLNTDTSLLQTVFFVPGETQEKKTDSYFWLF